MKSLCKVYNVPASHMLAVTGYDEYIYIYIFTEMYKCGTITCPLK
jgi:hypothetical protein